jgi:hypothetical protein
MKYKIKFLIIPTLLLFMLFSACSDVLDSAPDGKISLDEVFSDNDMTAAYLNSAYVYIPGGGASTYFHCRAPSVWCDEAWDVDAEAEAWISSGNLYSGSASASSHPIANSSSDSNNGDYWNRQWQGIRKCSVFLSRIDNAPVTSEANRSRWIAEAHLLRAYYYMTLLRWFGCGLPIEEQPYTLDFDYTPVKKASYYETVKFIISECDLALSSPNLPWRITSNAEAYRLTKSVAEGIKSRMILYAASPLYNDGQNYWEEAYQVNKTSLANLRAQNFELYNKINFPGTWKDANAYFDSDYAALFNEYFCNTMIFSDNPVDKETIYQTNAGQAESFHIDGIGAQWQYKTGTCPSQELVDCFETIDGEPILNLAKPYNDEVTHLNPNYNTKSVYKEQDPYANRDPRFYATIYYNGSKRYCYWPFDESVGSPENYPAKAGVRTRIIATWDGEPQTGISPTSRKMTRTSYYERKFNHPTAGDQGTVYVNLSQPKAIRFAEIILNFAESAAEANHLDEARAAVNEIRARVGMPALPAGLSQTELLLRIRNEQRVEFALEGNRYYDVRRLRKPDEDLENTDRWITAMWITRNSDGSYTYKRGPVSKERLCYTNKFMWLPVPMNEVNIMKSLTGDNWQNPGW